MLSVKNLIAGESYVLGEGRDATMIRPEGLFASKTPVRAVASGWELDAHGVSNGLLRLRGREEDPTRISAAPIPLVPGDWGLLQYGAFSLFFQFAHTPPPLTDPRTHDTLIRLALASSFVLHVGIFSLVRVLTAPPPMAKPAELSRPEEIAARFGVDRAFLEQPDFARGGDLLDRGPTVGDSESKVGRKAKENRTELSGEIRGGIEAFSDSLAGEMGEELRYTLRAIGSLGGLNAQNILLGTAAGAGLKGGGRGGVSGPGERQVTVSSGTGSVSGGLSDEQIRRVVTAHLGAFRACYESDTDRNPNLKGGVTIKWQTTVEGNVITAALASSTLGNPRIEGCLVRQVKTWKLPSSTAPSNVEWPFKFALAGGG